MSPATLRHLRIRLAGQRAVAMGLARDRLGIVLILFLILSAIVTGRLIDLSVVHATGASASSSAAPRAQREDIVDRNGVVLATSLEVHSLAAKPSMILHPDHVARQIVNILPSLNVDKVARDLARNSKFVWIKRKITPAQVLKLNALGEPGLKFLKEYERVYPNAMMASHILGYTDVDGRGISGFEQFFDAQLARQHADQPIALTIDSRVQHALEDEIRNGMEKFSAIGGFGLVLDVHTGDIMALASVPGFDPNKPEGQEKSTHFNHVTKGVYELGSVFKSFAIAQALEEGTTQSGKRYDCTEPLRVAGFKIDDFHAERRWMTTTDIFIHSSNIGTARIIDDVGTDKQRVFLDSLGLLSAPKLELPELGRPIVPNPWGRLATMTVAYGHGLAVTPLQMATGMAALINGGYRITPHIVRDPTRLVVRKRVLSQATSDQMRALFRLAVLQGTGGFADVEGYRVGGKTGTADKPQAGRYAQNARISTFAAAFPMDAPRYVVIASLDEPKGISSTGGYATGGQVAAPLVHNLILRTAPVLGVVKSDTDVDTSPLMRYVAHPKKKRSPL